MNAIDTILAHGNALPSAPQILPKLMGVLNDPDTDVSQVVDLIAFDPGLTIRVLKLCNSAAMGGATPVSDIPEAVNRIGMQSIYQMVAAASGRQAMQPRQPVAGLDPEALWKHSVSAALAAQIIATDLNDDVSSIFTLALLHDAGKIVMAEAFKDDYGRLLTRHAEDPAALCAEERERFNIDHAEVGGRLLTQWKFPAELAAAVCFQHAPAAAGTASRLAAYVQLADAVANLVAAPAPACVLSGAGVPPATTGVSPEDIDWSAGLRPGAIIPDSERAGSETGAPMGMFAGETPAEAAGTAAPLPAPATLQALEILELPVTSLAGYRERTLENFEFVNALCRS